jgi:hypothetical protein
MWNTPATRLSVGYGIGGKSDIQLGDVKVDHFKFEPMNGGSVLISFRIIAHPETADVGKLCEFIQQNIDLTLMPPEATTPGELFKDGEQAAPAPAARKKTKAEIKEENLAAAQAQIERGGGRRQQGSTVARCGLTLPDESSVSHGPRAAPPVARGQIRAHLLPGAHHLFLASAA